MGTKAFDRGFDSPVVRMGDRLLNNDVEDFATLLRRLGPACGTATGGLGVVYRKSREDNREHADAQYQIRRPLQGEEQDEDCG